MYIESASLINSYITLNNTTFNTGACQLIIQTNGNLAFLLNSVSPILENNQLFITFPTLLIW